MRDSFASKAALKLARWALEENDRIKASKIARIADKLEEKYVNSKEFKKKKAANRRGEVYTVLKTPVERPTPPKARIIRRG